MHSLYHQIASNVDHRRGVANDDGWPVLSDDFDDDDVRVAILSAQSRSDLCPRSFPACGPYVRDDSGVIRYRSSTPEGQVVYLWFVPKLPIFCSLMMRTFHRESAHGGSEDLIGRIFLAGFFIPGARPMAKKLVAHCLTCRIFKSRRQWDSPPEPATDVEDLLLRHTPYHAVFMDFWVAGEGVYYASFMCMATGHLSLIHTESQNVNDAVTAVRHLQARQGGVRYLYVDRASYFRSSKFQKRLDVTVGASVILTSTSSPWEKGELERSHELACHRMRVLLRSTNGKIAKLSASEKQRIADEACLLVNTRPRFFKDGILYTSDMLCYGFNRAKGCLMLNSSPFEKLRRNVIIDSIRSRFLETAWRELKHRSWEALKSKCNGTRTAADLLPGDPVLVRVGQARKLAAAFRLAHVQRSENSRQIWLRFCDGSTAMHNRFNIAYLPGGSHD